MTILSTDDLDLISPFPSRERYRIWGFSYCYSNMSALGNYETTHWVSTLLDDSAKSFLLVDRDNKVVVGRELPPVGVVTVDSEGQVHFAISRKAFKAGLLEQALLAVVKDSQVALEVTVSAKNIPLVFALRSVAKVVRKTRGAVSLTLNIVR